MADSSDTQSLDSPALGQPSNDNSYQSGMQADHLYAADNQAGLQPGQEIAATISSSPSSMPMNTEVSLRQQAPPPLVQRPPYNPSTARLDMSGVSGQPPTPQYSPPQQQYQPADVAGQMQTIEIAPHPTTNRFPWTPINNPSIPVPETPQPQPEPVYVPPVPQPVAEVTRPAPTLQPQPAPPQQQEPDVEPTPPAPILTEPVISPPPIEAPPLTVESLPSATLVPFSEPQNLELPTSDTQPAPIAAPAPIAPPQNPPKQHRRGSKSVHIYSESTQEAWHVFKPSKILKFFTITFVAVSVVAAFIFWQSIGAPTNPMDVPFLKPLLNAE